MAVAEPSGLLWERVKPMIGGWPDSNEDLLASMADGWNAAALSAQSAIEGAQRSAAATNASWQDRAGGTLTTALSNPERTAQAMREFGVLAGQSRHFGGAVRATKTEIASTVAINEPLYQMAAAMPVPVADQFAGAVAQHLNGVIDQQAAEVAGYPSAQPVAFETGAAGGPGTADLKAARAEFFGTPPPGTQRQILQTDAIPPGGEDGIIVSRFFIADEAAGFGNLHGDGRGPSDDPNAGHRFSIAWDTRTGEVSLTVHPSTIYPYSVLVNPPRGVPGVPLPGVGPVDDVVVDARPITVGPGGEPNNFVVEQAAPGVLRVSYNVLNSAVPVGEANGTVGIAAIGDTLAVNLQGPDNYPDAEIVQYRDEGTRMLGNKPMSPFKEGAVFPVDDLFRWNENYERDWVLPR